MNVSLYLPKATKVHQLDGRTKILFLLALCLMALLFSHPGYLLVVFMGVIGLLIGSRAGRNVKKGWLLTGLLFCYSVLLWPFFVQGVTPVPFFHWLGVTWEGVWVGMGMGLRLLIMLWGGIWLLSTTTIEEMALAAQRLGLPSRIAFAFSLAFRWVGMLLGAGVGIVQAQRSRGLNLSSGGIFHRLRQYVPLVVPLIGHVLRQTNLLAMSLESKGYHPTARRHVSSPTCLRSGDYAVLTAALLLMGLCAWMRWKGLGVLAFQF